MASLQDDRRILVIPYRVVMHALNVATPTATVGREALKIIRAGVIREELEPDHTARAD